MNKQDGILIFILIILSLLGMAFFYLSEKDGPKKAVIYYEDQVVLEIDLTQKEEKTYQVEGFNGMVTIESKDGKVKVASENSPLHLCSKQGYISSSYETIVCLPNKIVVAIEANDSLDAVAK